MSLLNKTIGKLFVKEIHHIDDKGRKYYICICQCGNVTKPLRCDVISKGNKSCGIDLCSKNIKNLFCKTFGQLKVVKLSHIDSKTGTARWVCECKCGNVTKPLLSDNIIKGDVSTCGIGLCKLKNNLEGLVFGQLKVVAFDKMICGASYWICQCKCGKIKSIRGQSLINKKTISCGNGICNGMINNLVGKKFGTLSVLKYAGSIKNKTYWTCQCDCGNIIDLCRSDTLMNNRMCSCSLFGGERNLKAIIQDIYPDYKIVTHCMLDFLKPQHLDLCLFNQETNIPFLAIEYDGEQHFRPVRFGGISIERAEEAFKYTKKLDKRKNIKMAANKHVVPFFVRISYKCELSVENIKKFLISRDIPV